MLKSKTGLIIGGSGALGSSVVTVFKRRGWKLLNIDVKANDHADSNFVISTEKRL